MRITIRPSALAVLLAALASGFVGCGTAEKRRGANARADGGLVAGGASSDPLVLTTEHPGWKKQLCLSCHGAWAPYPHADAGYSPPVCVNCHGTNGAPHRDHATLENDGCKSCHGNVAHTASFKAPDDCVVCHNHSASQSR